ncbi:MAG: glutaminase [Bacteroidaceae bacterium]|nr:glutaminase [Bacteroidaceae bacterium]
METVVTKQDIKDIAIAAYEHCKRINEGNNAKNIPYFAKEDSELFGLTICFVDGDKINLGDSNYIFALDSISAVATTLLVLKEYGCETLQKMIGVNSNTIPYDFATAMLLEKGYPINALTTAGALATVSMVHTIGNRGQKWKYICDNTNALCGSRTEFIEELFRSQSAQNTHNRTTAWLLDGYNRIYDDPELTLELYTKQCSLGVTTEQLATFAATIANGGVNPMNKNKIFDRRHAAKIVSLMANSGIPLHSGEWMFSAGIPAKTGVSGGIMGVFPGLFGIAAFAPPLDDTGCSVRAQAVIKYIMGKSGLNIYNGANTGVDITTFIEPSTVGK